MHQKKILLTARDPGAVGHVYVLYKWLHKDNKITIITSGTAHNLLQKLGIKSIKFTLINESNINLFDTQSSILLNEAKRLIQSLRPDLIITSLSSFGAGIDEATNAVAPQKAIAVQDFWGDVNLSLGITASKYFVMDKFAYQLTKSKCNTECIVTGSIRHTQYSEFDIPKMRMIGRLKFGIKNKLKIIGWFGQKIEIPGYSKVIEDFVKSLKNFCNDNIIIYRGHPKFVDTCNKELLIFKKAGINAINVTNSGSTEEWLATCDLIVTSFSLCGLDHAYLSKYSSIPIGNVMYLMTNKKIRNYARHHIGIIEFPTIKNKIGHLVKRAEDTKYVIDKLLHPDSSNSYFEASKKLGNIDTKEIVMNYINTL